MAGYLPIGGNGGGTGINLPDDHIFATTEARDAAIPTPFQGEQCAVQAGEPQYHLLQEYRVDAWVDITYVIRGPKGDSGGGSGSDPSKGFTLDKNTAIKTQMPDGTAVDFVSAPGGVQNLLLGNRQQGLNISTYGNGVYVQYDHGTGRVLLDDTGVPGIKMTPLTEGAYASFNYEGWATVIDDHSAGDICYFVQSFKGALFSGLPESITLDPDTDYVIASEVTQRKGSTGFAHRLSIISANQEDDNNNRTIQRAGISFDDAKNRWSEVMLKRDAVVFDDMTVALPEVFSTITPGDNMTGEVIDGVLTLSATPPNDRVFDTITTRILDVHESPENSDKYTRWYIDGNFNTEVHSVGDTHYYAKNKVTDELIEAYQVLENGNVDFKHSVSFSNQASIYHENELGMVLKGDSFYGVGSDGYQFFFIEKDNFNVKSKKIQKVREGTASDDAVNVSQLEAVHAQLITLSNLVQQQEEHIHSLEESNGESFGTIELYSSQPNEVRIDSTRMNGEVVSQTIQLGNAPPPGPLPPPDPNDLTVYFGWDINSRALIQADDITNYLNTDERSATTGLKTDELMSTEWALTRSDNSIYKYIYVAYPKDVLNPNPYKVEYSGFVATWLTREIEINGIQYIILISELPNISDSFAIKLHY